MATECDNLNCPLCGGNDTTEFLKDRQRTYWQCLCCKLVFVPEHYWLSAEDEKATYDLHENDVKDQGYRQFLSRISKPLIEKIGPKQKGLDFGCGPGPALADMFAEHGHKMDIYDPFYHNDTSVFQKEYNFICATEVVEHLHNPNKEFTTLFNMLKRGGWLGIMTKLVIDEHAFRNWHYIRDMTHICFYCRSTFEYIAERFDTELNFVANDVILFKKK